MFDLDFQSHAIKIEFFHYHRWIPWPRKHTHEKYFKKIRTGRQKSRGGVASTPPGRFRLAKYLGHLRVKRNNTRYGFDCVCLFREPRFPTDWFSIIIVDKRYLEGSQSCVRVGNVYNIVPLVLAYPSTSRLRMEYSGTFQRCVQVYNASVDFVSNNDGAIGKNRKINWEVQSTHARSRFSAVWFDYLAIPIYDADTLKRTTVANKESIFFSNQSCGRAILCFCR